jgi:hypothetical protein
VALLLEAAQVTRLYDAFLVNVFCPLASTYDANGNQTAATGLGRTVTYTSYNKPASIHQGTLSLTFADDVDHQRFKQTTMAGSTVTTTRYLNAFGVRGFRFPASLSHG